MKQLKIDSAIIPGGCTKFIQAPDVSWNAPFKSKIRQLYEDWMLHGEKEATSGGNPRPPSMDIYLQWIVAAWDALPVQLIKKSFKECGITNALDGSEDDFIHCFKPHGPIPSGLENLKLARADEEIAKAFDNIALNVANSAPEEIDSDHSELTEAANDSDDASIDLEDCS